MEAVYAVRPFWGWKRALHDAGLSYDDIPVELQDYVVCRICGAEKASLTLHLFHRHNVTPSDYRIDYPDAPLTSETLRAAKTRMKSSVLDHWESIWTPEYVLDRLDEFRRHGFPIDEKWVKQEDKAFVSATRRRHGGWRGALETIGADPEEVTRQAFLRTRRYPDKDSVVAGIVKREKAGRPNNAYVLGKHGEHADTALLYCAIEYFGSWDSALTAAALEPSTVRHRRPNHPYPNGKSCIETIRERDRGSRPLNLADVARGPQADRSLVRAAVRHFGSWDDALRAAGLAPDRIAKGPTVPSPR